MSGPTRDDREPVQCRGRLWDGRAWVRFDDLQTEIAQNYSLTYMTAMSRPSHRVRELAAADVIAIIEALYEWELPHSEWTAGIMQQLEQSLGLGGGSGVQLYDTSRDERFELLAIDQRNTPEGWMEAGGEMTREPERAAEYLRVHRTQMVWSVAPFLPHVPFGERMRATMAASGYADMLAINGHSPSGIGCCLYAFADRYIRFTPQRALQLRRIASHVATAHRLRQKLAASDNQLGGVDAILDARGRLQHIEDPRAVTREGRESLSAALQAREWARGRARRDEPNRALSEWKGLVSARWTLVDKFESDGKRYVLARENTLQLEGHRMLSEREREVVALAIAGRSNKVIAYELGIAHATVRVLIARASAKLNVRTREELVRRVRHSAHSACVASSNRTSHLKLRVSCEARFGEPSAEARDPK
jgi:DNA-binding CsgD family transcriptional regulator